MKGEVGNVRCVGKCFSPQNSDDKVNYVTI